MLARLIALWPAKLLVVLFLQSLHAQRVIHTGLDFAAAVADPEVTSAVLAADIVLREGDWQGYPTPIRVTRNLTVVGVAGPVGGGGPGAAPVVAGPRPVVDMQHLQGKVQLGYRVVLSVSNVALVNAVDGMYNIAPRLDLLAPSLPDDQSLLFGRNIVLVLPLCYPADLQTQVDLVPRPPWVPGVQKVTAVPNPPGCVNVSHSDITIGAAAAANSSGGGWPTLQQAATLDAAVAAVPYERRCWAQIGVMGDLALTGTALDRNQKQVSLFYTINGVDSTYLCAEELSYECITELNTIGCMLRRLAGGAPPPPAPGAAGAPPSASLEPGPLPVQPPAGSGGGGTGGVPLGAVLGGAVGGAVVVFVLTMVLALKRRHRRLGEYHQKATGGGSACLEPTGKEPGAAGPGHSEPSGSGFPGQQSLAAQPCTGGHAAGRAAASPAPRTSIVCTWHSSLLGGTGSQYSGAGSARAASSLQPHGGRSTADNTAGSGVLSSSSASGGGYGGGFGRRAGSTTTASSAAAPSSYWGHSSGFHSSAASASAASVAAAASADPLFVLSPLTPQRPDLRLLDHPGPGSLSCPAPGVEAGVGAEVELLPTVLGKGGFGRVVEGRYRGMRVAVKLILDDSLAAWGLKTSHGAGIGSTAAAFARAVGTYNSTTDEGGPRPPWANAPVPPSDGSPASRLAEALAAEVEVLGRCNHPNILTLYAACLTPPRLCLVMERMDTSLDKMIYGNPGQLIPMEEVVSIALDVARGLEYLHPTVVHRDLKPGNVLVNQPGTPRQLAKLSDFGLARLRGTMAMWTENPEVGTPEYMAPELYNVDNNIVTHKVDVYAFGVLLWAMLSGQRPWPGLQMVVIAYRVNVLKDRPALDAIPPDRRPLKLLRLLRQCWDAVPERRPAAAELVKELLLLREQLTRQSAGGMDAQAEGANPSPVATVGAGTAAAPAAAAPPCPAADDTAAVGPEPAALDKAPD